MIRADGLLKAAGANKSRSSSASSISAGTGQVSPITAVRRRYSATVVWPTPTERAIVRTLAPHACFSRKTSRTFRIDNLSAGIVFPRLGGPRYRSSDRRLRPREPLLRAVRDQSESVSALRRNRCPPSVGIRSDPGRGAILGLLAAALGIRRHEEEAHAALSRDV